MTVAIHTSALPSLHDQLLPVLDAAVRASVDAHEATRALTDTVTRCLHLPADVYWYAPGLSQATAALTSATRALTSAMRYATANPAPEHVQALSQAATAVVAATVDLRRETMALAQAADTAAAWRA
jgi:hypothetical protein